MSRQWRVRPATEDDVDEIDAMVRELARYEREPDAVTATADDVRAALFGPSPQVQAHVAQVRSDAGWQVAGMAVWYVTYSTWRGRHGIWLEDLYVRPEHRALGIGRGLLGELAAQCVARGYPRLEWWVLDWNSPAHDFYRGVGATPQQEWTVWRLDDEALAGFAASGATGSPGDAGTTQEVR